MTRPPLTGVCLVRLEHQGNHVLITLLCSGDVHSGTAARRRHFVDLEDALDHLREFVEAFRGPGPGGHDAGVTER